MQQQYSKLSNHFDSYLSIKMNAKEALKFLEIPTFYYALHNPQQPQRRSLQQHININNIKSYFTFAYEYAKNKYIFALALDISQYYAFYHLVRTNDRHFYAIYLHSPRHLYLDIDYYSKSYVPACKLAVNIAPALITWLCNLINSKKVKLHCQKLDYIQFKQFIVFNSSRWNKRMFKVSLHVFNPFIIWYGMHHMINDIQQIKHMAEEMVNTEKTLDCSHFKLAYHIDESVYDDYQPMRMVGCTKYGEPKSIKKVLLLGQYNKQLKNLIGINVTDNVQGIKNRVWLPFINNQPKIKSKIDTLKKAYTNTKIQCQEVNILSHKCYICSVSKHSIATFTFKSIVNQLEWIEHRCLNKACEQILQYTALNSNLEYPRILANLPLKIKEIESIYEALQVFRLQIHSHYKFLLNDNKIIKQTHLKRTEIGFTKNTCASSTCGHAPEYLIIKDKEHKYIELDGKYTIQCNECTSRMHHQDINLFR